MSRSLSSRPQKTLGHGRILPATVVSIWEARNDSQPVLNPHLPQTCGEALPLRKNADERPARRCLRPEIAHETVLGANLYVSSCGVRGTIDQHSADRRFIRIGNRKLFKAVIVHEFLPGLLCQQCCWSRTHHAGCDERLLHKSPA